MSGETLYTIAFEMLSNTNVFNQALQEIKYTKPGHEEISLLSFLNDNTSRYGSRFCQRTENNLQIAYECIVSAMIVYLEDFPSTFSFKQQTREIFREWVDKIQKEYSIKM